MNAAEEIEARVKNIVDTASPGVKSKMLTEIQADVDRSKVLTSFITSAPGAFCITQLSKDITIQQDYLHDCELLVAMGSLNRFGDKRGWYAPKKLDLEVMDFVNADDTPSNVWLPFDLNEKVQLYQGNAIIIAGAPNSGKTALMLNIIKENMSRLNVHYFNSEMSGGELKTRLKKFDHIGIDQWDFNAYRRADDFQDVIKPGPENLNIIDYLEVHEDFYAVGKKIKEIHDALGDSLAIIGIQKNPGSDVGLGGFRSLEVTRLALAIDFGRIKIVKAKNFEDENGNGEDPNGLVREFKILHSSQLVKKGGWHKDKRKEG